MVTFAVTLSDLIEKGGAYAGLAAFFGLAVLAVLYFAQARELKRLREWAGRAPERAQELEERVVAQAEEARRVRVAPKAKPAVTKTGPVTAAAQPAAAASAAPPSAVASTPAVDPSTEESEAGEAGETTSVTPPTETEEGTPAEHEVVVSKVETPSTDGETTPNETEEDADAVAEDGELEAVTAAGTPAGAQASAATTTPALTAPPQPAPPASATGNGSGEIPTIVPRATPQPPPRRSAPAPAPYRPDRPLPPRSPLSSQLGEEPQRRNGAVIAGAGAGLILLIVAIIAILGGGGNDGGGGPTTSTGTTAITEPGATNAPTTSTRNPGTGGGNRAPAGPARTATKVETLNGTTIAGLATSVDNKIQQAGWASAGTPANFYEQTRSATIVFYATSVYRAQAQAVAKLLGVGDVQLVDANTRRLAPDANVVVVVGSDQSP
ncbi:MAG: hypothetical protein QOF76_3266 [Solirubrobacteraceae bacterium]|jgi:hypothetical protein|nr:hypothetical protein [Solirubrobacteraceae bacterium]